MMNQEVEAGSDNWLWNKFRSSRLWRLLKRIPSLRSSYFLIIELLKILRESRTSSLEMIDEDFTRSNDPWNYETNPTEQERFSKQTDLLDEARGNRIFQSGLEIGCAEGLYTEVLAERCQSLLVLDLSPTALARTQRRRQWSEGVRFDAFDLRKEAIPGTFELIVVAGVLEYFSNPRTFFKIREKLTAALRPNGYLMLETTRGIPVVEGSWWGRRLIRGKWINFYISKHRSLAIVSEATSDSYAITLFRKAGPGKAS